MADLSRSRLAELDALSVELSQPYQPLPAFAAARCRYPAASRTRSTCSRPGWTRRSCSPHPRAACSTSTNFRRHEWAVTVDTSGVATAARIYDLRSTFASNALAAGVTIVELARVMGTSVRMIERHYGTLLDGAHACLVGRLDAIEATLEEATREAASD